MKKFKGFIEKGSILDQLGWTDYDFAEVAVGLMILRNSKDSVYKFKTGWETKNENKLYGILEESRYQRSHISLEAGKKYLARNDENVFVFSKNKDGSFDAIVVGNSDADILIYLKNGQLEEGRINDWDIVGEA